MTVLASTLPDIELLGARVRPPSPAPPSPWRAPPLPDIERIGAPAGRAPAPALARPAARSPRRPPAAPRRTHWPAPARRASAPPAAAAPPPPPPPAPARVAELEIPAFLTRPRPEAVPVSVAAPSPVAAPARAVAPPRRARPRWGRIGAAALLVAGITTLAGLAGGGIGEGPASPAAAEPAGSVAAAVAEIPPGYLALYKRFARANDIDWRFLAAIGAQESDHGRNPWASRVNADGCIGPMQLGVGGRCGDFVGTWGVDGDGDGRIDPRDPADAIATAARGLRLGKGAPPVGGDADGYRRAACGYYGACSDARADYADEVMARAARYGFSG